MPPPHSNLWNVIHSNKVKNSLITQNWKKKHLNRISELQTSSEFYRQIFPLTSNFRLITVLFVGLLVFVWRMTISCKCFTLGFYWVSCSLCLQILGFWLPIHTENKLIEEFVQLGSISPNTFISIIIIFSFSTHFFSQMINKCCSLHSRACSSIRLMNFHHIWMLCGREPNFCTFD